jgi:hypothetical protein
MKEARLYYMNIKSANTRAATDDFIAEQRRITGGVKRGIRKTLEKSGLSAEFAFAAKRVPGHARMVQVYATDEALKEIRKVPGVESVEPATISMYSLKKTL